MAICPAWQDYRGTIESCETPAEAPVRWTTAGSHTFYDGSWEEWALTPETHQRTLIYDTRHEYCGEILMDLSGWYRAPSPDPLHYARSFSGDYRYQPLRLTAQADAPTLWQVTATLDGAAWPVTLTVLDATQCTVEFSIRDASGDRHPERYTVTLVASVAGVSYTLTFDLGYFYPNWCY